MQWHKTLRMHIAPLIFRLNRAKALRTHFTGSQGWRPASPPATVDGSVLESLCGCKDFLFFYFFLLQVMERAGRWGDGSKLAFSYVIRRLGGRAPPPRPGAEAAKGGGEGGVGVVVVIDICDV
jgi:hypothetical protein